MSNSPPEFCARRIQRSLMDRNRREIWWMMCGGGRRRRAIHIRSTFSSLIDIVLPGFLRVWMDGKGGLLWVWFDDKTTKIVTIYRDLHIFRINTSIYSLHPIFGKHCTYRDLSLFLTPMCPSVIIPRTSYKTNQQTMLQYSDHFPIRLLSLPTEQQHMIKRLKLAKQAHKQSHTEAPPPLRYRLPASELSSYRVHTQNMDYCLSGKRTKPIPVSLELRSTLLSKEQKQGKKTKSSILDEVPIHRKLSLLKQLMAKNAPFSLSKYHQTPSDTIQLQAICPKNTPSFSKDYHKRLQKNRKQQQLRNILIIKRVKQTRDINTVILKISSSKMVPI